MRVDGSNGDGEDIDVNISVDAGKYITFQTSANTRGTLIEDKYIKGSFGVYGYEYDFSKSWTGQRAVALPNVFWNEENGNKMPLKVSENAGFYTYYAKNADAEDAGQINWTGNRYAFFAYYPYNLETSGMNVEGSPYLTYSVDRKNAKNHIDVMTGGVSQLLASECNNTVSFSMAHRLAGVDVSISNVYVHSYKGDNGINIDEDVDIEISELQIDFENLMYDKAKIFLEKNRFVPALNSVLENIQGETTASYKLIGMDSNSGETTFTVLPTEKDNTNITKATGTSMTFIPQPYDPDNGIPGLEVTATVTYRMKGTQSGYFEKAKVNEEGDYVDAAGNEIPLDANGNPTQELYYEGSAERPFKVIKKSTFTQPLVESSRYYVVLTFTSEAVSINIITAAEWEELDHPVDIEFM